MFFIIEGCRHSTVSVKDLISSDLYSEIYVNLRCIQIGKTDTIDICYPYADIMCCLEEDRATQHLCSHIDDYVLGREILMLPESHFLLKQAIVPNSYVDFVYAQGVKQLLKEFFFCYNELDKENCCCLDMIHSACGSSAYFGHWSTPCYAREDDNIMDNSKQQYIISLLYKNNIYCLLDANGNIRLLNYNLKKEDFIHIPYPVIEIR